MIATPSRSEDLAAYSDAANELFKEEPEDKESLPMEGTQLAGGTSFQTDAAIGQMKKEGYLDGEPKVTTEKSSPGYSTGKSDRQLRDIANSEKSALQLEELWKKSRPELTPAQRRAGARKANGLPP